VRRLARELLEGLAGDELGNGGLRAFQGMLAQKNKARAWWERAKKIGEEEYAVSHVLAKDAKSPNRGLLWLLHRKYPRHLPPLYRTVLKERPEVESWSLAEAMARSKLPREQKVELLSYGARHEGKDHRQAAFDAIAQLDHELFV